MKTVRCHVRKAAIGEVGERSEIGPNIFADMIVQIIRNSRCLVLWTREIITEPAGAGDPGDLGINGLSAADSSDIRTGTWELRSELRSLLAVI